MEIYLDLSGWVLSEITHKKGSPWYVVWHEHGGKDEFGKIIPNQEIEKHFKLAILPKLLNA